MYNWSAEVMNRLTPTTRRCESAHLNDVYMILVFFLVFLVVYCMYYMCRLLLFVQIQNTVASSETSFEHPSWSMSRVFDSCIWLLSYGKFTWIFYISNVNLLIKTFHEALSYIHKRHNNVWQYRKFCPCSRK